MTNDAPATTLDRRDGPYGEVALRRRGGVFEIIANGCFLMDTSDGRSERLLVDAALAELAAVERPSLLLGGLGVGFSLAAAARARWARITVVEREAAVVDWHRGGAGWLAPFSAGALDDPRVHTVLADLVEWIRQPPDGAGRPSASFDAICLDTDNGPEWTVTEGNRGLYTASGLLALRRRLAPGGVLAVWSARPSDPFRDRLAEHFAGVRTLPVRTGRGAPDVVYLARRND